MKNEEKKEKGNEWKKTVKEWIKKEKWKEWKKERKRKGMKKNERKGKRIKSEENFYFLSHIIVSAIFFYVFHQFSISQRFCYENYADLCLADRWERWQKFAFGDGKKMNTTYLESILEFIMKKIFLIF